MGNNTQHPAALISTIDASKPAMPTLLMLSEHCAKLELQLFRHKSDVLIDFFSTSSVDDRVKLFFLTGRSLA
ncbi:MAG: hypothetical protein H7836_15310 [Magnetococcus sp. YQC-3]